MDLSTHKNLQLPAMPAIAMQLLHSLSDDDGSTQDLARLIRNDPAIHAKVLQAANSPAFRVGAKIDALDRAVVWLGRKTVMCLALSFAMTPKRHADELVDRAYNDYWHRSVTQAVTMELLAEKLQSEAGGFAFAAGLLLDIGVLALLQHHESEYVAILTEHRGERSELLRAEEQAFGMSHAEFSAQLLRHWDVPEIFYRLAEKHTMAVGDLLVQDPGDGVAALSMAVAADATADFLLGSHRSQDFARLCDVMTGQVLDYTVPALDRHINAVEARLQEVSECFSLEPSHLPSPGLFAAALEKFAFQAYQDDQKQSDLLLENEVLRAKLREAGKQPT